MQLLIDAGGRLNGRSSGPLWRSLCDSAPDAAKVRLLLAEPSLDLTFTEDGKTPEQFARRRGKTAAADMIRDEVRATEAGVVNYHRISSSSIVIECRLPIVAQVARRAVLVR